MTEQILQESNVKEKKYTRAEAVSSTIEYFAGDELAANVWVNKYALKDSDGNIYELNPRDMHRRIASELARIEAKYPNALSEEQIFALLDNFKYIVPQGGPMTGIGNNKQVVSLSNCFVVGNPDGMGDSYGAILRNDEKQIQLMKRRCVSADTKVLTKHRGLIAISEVNVGDLVYSFDADTGLAEYNAVLNKWETEVAPQDRIVYTTENGTMLKTSVKHPVLIDNAEYLWKTNVSVSDNLVRPLNEAGEYQILSMEEARAAWFAGAHLGDGSADINTNGATRFRMTGDNEAVIKAYTDCIRQLGGSNVQHTPSNRKDYKTKCWSVHCRSKNNTLLLEKYLDGQSGNKTYKSNIPKFINEKLSSLFWPFLAGLIDTDGHVDHDGRVSITLANKELIDQVASILSGFGYRYRVRTRILKASNASTAYKLTISNVAVMRHIHAYLRHNVKRTILDSKLTGTEIRSYSKKFYVSEAEYQEISNMYESCSNKTQNLISCVRYFRKNNGQYLGIGTLNEMLKCFGENFRPIWSKIQRRQEITSVETDCNTQKYYDIEVDKVNNFFAGNFGLVVIHNCGVGLDLSDIRPAGSPVNNAAITSTGIVPFMERYSNSTREVAQDGRRGALMLTVSIRHPEAGDFIDAKMDTSKVTGANVSVKIHDDFMEAMLSGTSYRQYWPLHGEPKVQKDVDAKALWDKIINNAWKSAEPGVLFWDKIISESPADCYSNSGFRTVSTNPCGELPLCTGDSCRLLALVLYSYVVNPFTKDAYFDWVKFKADAIIAQRLMDDIVDLELEKIDQILAKINSDPENDDIKRTERQMWEEIRYKCEAGRRTGTGVTAEGDMLAALGLKYGTPEATEFATEVHRVLALCAYKSSVTMAKERGAFPIYDSSLEVHNPFLNRIKSQDAELARDMELYGRRNIALLTIAPTGTVSLMTQTTSGIECAFMLSYMRRRKVNPNDKDVKIAFVDEVGDSWEEYMVFHHHLKTWLEANGYDVDAVSKMLPDEWNSVVEQTPYHGALSNDVDWVEKVRMQGQIQQWVDHSISVTVNLPGHVTPELVNDVYVTAWKSGCKGCTIYRDGSRSGVLVATTENDKKEELKAEAKEELFSERHAPKRPKYLECDVHRFMNKGDKWIGFVGVLDGRPYEVFTGPAEAMDLPSNIEGGWIRKTKHEGGNSYDFMYEDKDGNENYIIGLNEVFDRSTHDTSRTFSAILRHGMPLPYVITLIESLHLDGDLINTWKNGFKRMIKKYVPDGTEVKVSGKAKNCQGNEGQKCNLVYQEGCLICTTCGNSKCG